MSETVTKSFFQASNNDGFAPSGSTTFDSLAVAFGAVGASKFTVSGNADYAGTVIQGATHNRYTDLGVPEGAKILGLKILGGFGSIIQNADGNMDGATVKFWTIEAEFEEFAIETIGEGVYKDISAANKVASDYVQFQIDFTASTGLIEETPESGIEIQLQEFVVEITYQRQNKGNMFFGV